MTSSGSHKGKAPHLAMKWGAFCLKESPPNHWREKYWPNACSH